LPNQSDARGNFKSKKERHERQRLGTWGKKVMVSNRKKVTSGAHQNEKKRSLKKNKSQEVGLKKPWGLKRLGPYAWGRD